MIRYLLASGQRCPPALVKALEESRSGAPDIAVLVTTHGHLARLVAPATPVAIWLLDSVSRDRWTSIGAVRIGRYIMFTAVGFVGMFIILSLYQQVVSAGGAQPGAGRLLTNELFWLTAAGMGASFAMLFQVSQFISNRTYDPIYAPTYWIKLLLGVIAGFILVALVPMGEAAEAKGGMNFTKPLIAMLGGFSASAVYRILGRLVEGVENLFSGSVREQVAVREQAAVQRVNSEAEEHRLSIAGQLVQVQQLVTGGAGDEAARRLQQVIDALLPAGEAEALEPVIGGKRLQEPQEPAKERVLTLAAVERPAEGEESAPARS